MNVLFVASEMFPLVKTGGLADVVGALPIALEQINVNVRVFLPNYSSLAPMLKNAKQIADLGNPLGFGRMTIIEGVLELDAQDAQIHVWLLHCDELFHREGGPYLNTEGQDYEDNHRRFGVFAWAASMLVAYGGWQSWRPDIVHAHDWQTGLVAAYLKSWGFHKIPVVFTIHNVQYTGNFDRSTLHELKIAPELYHVEGLEFYGQLSMLKAGIQFSDWITTVSPTYANEIQSPEFGCGLEGVFQKNHDKISGILNGVDYSVWDPNTDSLIRQNYSSKQLEKKQHNKLALQARFGLAENPKAIIFGVVSRLTSQKGLDLVLNAIPDLLGAGAQLVLLGSGDASMEQSFLSLADRFPRSVAITIGYDESLSHQIQAGADCLLIPSRFEPCGLTQLYALKYGTLPLVRETGGLADTIHSGVDGKPQTGFVFSEATVGALKQALRQAMSMFSDTEAWKAIQLKAMQQDYSWKQSAVQYQELYKRLVALI